MHRGINWTTLSNKLMVHKFQHHSISAQWCCQIPSLYHDTLYMCGTSRTLRKLKWYYHVTKYKNKINHGTFRYFLLVRELQRCAGTHRPRGSVSNTGRKSGGEADRDPPHVEGGKPWMDRTDDTPSGCLSPWCLCYSVIWPGTLRWCFRGLSVNTIICAHFNGSF